VKNDALTIRTPEGISFSLPLAGPVSRGLAWGIDAACIGAATSVCTLALRPLGLLSLDAAQAATIYGYFAVSIGYGLVFEWFWRGQTVGKKLMRLRVIDEQGLRLHFSQILVRNLLRFVDALPAFYLVGGAAMFFGRRAQRLGDIAANTVVVRTARAAEPDLDQILAGKYNSLREHRVPAARLRQQLTPALAGAALSAVLRRDQFDPADRVRLFAELAAHIRALVEFPPEATEDLADEQYVRNALDIVFRR